MRFVLFGLVQFAHDLLLGVQMAVLLAVYGGAQAAPNRAGVVPVSAKS